MWKRFSVSVIGRVFAALMQIAVLAALARALGVSGFGEFSAVSAVSMIALWVVDMGMGTRVLRGTSTEREQSALATFFISRSVVFVGFPTLVLILQRDNFNTFLALATVVYVIGESSGDIAVGIFQGRRLSVIAVSILLVRRASTLTLLLIPGAPGILALSISGFIGYISLAFSSFRRMRSPMSPFVLIKENFSIITSNGASTLGQLDVIIVRGVLGLTASGLYGVAMRLFNPINLFVTTLLQIFIPELSAAGSRRVRLQIFVRVRKFVIVAASSITLCSPLAPFFITWLYGEEFADAGIVGVAVFVAAALSSVSQLHLAWFYASKVPIILPLCMFLGVGLGLVSIWLFSSYFGLAGAAFGIVIMQVCILVLTYTIWRRDCSEIEEKG